MLILPARYEPKLFVPVPEADWREPSAAQERDQFGNVAVRTRFRVRALLDDGHPVWTGWFDSRDDYDAFCYSLIRHTELGEPMANARLPKPEWRDDLDHIPLRYDFNSITLITASPGSEVGATLPADYNASNNLWELIGGGASGGAARSGSTRKSTGGGAGAYKKLVNFNQAPSSSVTYRVGNFGAAVTRSTNGATNGNAGTSSYFKNSSATIVCEAFPGAAGNSGTAGALSAAAGGNGASGAGTSGNSGGASGAVTAAGAAAIATGGGGAAGPNGAGGNGTDIAVDTVTGPAGTGNGTNAGNGGDGKRDAANANDASNYGGGGGGVTGSGITSTSGKGAQGVISRTYATTTAQGLAISSTAAVAASKRTSKPVSMSRLGSVTLKRVASPVRPVSSTTTTTVTTNKRWLQVLAAAATTAVTAFATSAIVRSISIATSTVLGKAIAKSIVIPLAMSVVWAPVRIPWQASVRIAKALSQVRTIVVPALSRVIGVQAESRTIKAPPYDRSLKVPTQDRSLTVAPQNRTIIVPPEDLDG